MGLEQQILGIQHLGIVTGKLDADVEWYEERLGFQRKQQRVVPMNGRTEIAVLSRSDINLELVQPAGRLREEAKEKGCGKWDHFAIEVSNLEECAGEAAKKGLKFHASTPQGITEYPCLGAAGVRGVNYVGPSGEVIEFCRDNQADDKMGRGLLGWSHLALKVESLERTEAFYGKLGFVRNGGGYLSTPEGKIQIHYLEKAGFTLEVLEMIGSGLAELRRRGEGRIDHVAFQVRNAREAMDCARMAKLPLKNYTLQELPLFEKGIRFFFVAGPDGEKIEFVEIN